MKPKFYEQFFKVVVYGIGLVVFVNIADQLLAFLGPLPRNHFWISIPMGIIFWGIFVFLSWHELLEEIFKPKPKWNTPEWWPPERHFPNFYRASELVAMDQAKTAKQPLQTHAKKEWLKINFFAAVGCVFAWAICAWRMGMPINEEFLGSSRGHDSPWIGTLIFEALAVYWMFQRERRTLLFARIFVAAAGLYGIYVLVMTDAIHSPFEKSLAWYVWLSHLALAVFWPFRVKAAA